MLPRGSKPPQPKTDSVDYPSRQVITESSFEDDGGNPQDLLESPGYPPRNLAFTQTNRSRKTLDQWKILSNTTVFMKLAGPMLEQAFKSPTIVLAMATPRIYSVSSEEFMANIGFRMFGEIIPLRNLPHYYYPAEYDQYAIK